uniref:G-protein coupled receptors family 1 profile domain-containing protein n=1 Tax=Xiphophorus maculatus TaxID=8083 RepID=A0A3B5QJC4_XIPMA
MFLAKIVSELILWTRGKPHAFLDAFSYLGRPLSRCPKSCEGNFNTVSYTAFMAVLIYLMPAVVILFCYVNIIRVARSHARRIHSLQDSVQRTRSPSCPGDSSHQNCRSLHRPWSVTCHKNNEFESQTSKQGENISQIVQEAPKQQGSKVRGLFSILAQKNSQPPEPNHQQPHHGGLRLVLIIFAFLLCWTPYICVALVQATETAITGQSTLVPDSAITFSYWLMLLNSDVNPLLYALLSQRFQIALQGLWHRIRAHLCSLVHCTKSHCRIYSNLLAAGLPASYCNFYGKTITVTLQ